MARLSSLTNESGVSQLISEISATAVFDLGDSYEDDRGKFIYSWAGGAITQYQTLTMDTAVGVDTVTSGAAVAAYLGKKYGTHSIITDDASGFTSGALYKGYWGVVDDSSTAGEKGQGFRVADNDADNLFLEAPLTTLLADADVDITLFNPHRVKPVVTNALNAPVGVAPVSVTDEYYFWRQVAGIATVLVAGTTNTAGLSVGVTAEANGAGILAIAQSSYLDYTAFNKVGEILFGAGKDDAEVMVKLTLGW